MYVLIVARGFPDESYKMNGIFEFDQAKALSAIGIKVVYAALDLRSIRRIRKFGRKSVKIDGVNVEVLSLPCGNIPKNILYNIGTMSINMLFKDIIRKHGVPDIIHSHFTQFGFFVNKALYKYNIPKVITEHSSLIHKGNIDINLYKVAKIAYEKSEKVIAVSNSLSRSINEKFGIKPITIHNIVDTNLFQINSEKEKKIEKFRFISTGRLIQGKRMDLLIEAFYNIFSENESVCLHIFGDGPERETLENMIREYNLNSQVQMMGTQSRDVISEYMKQADCFVLASQSETFGVSYIEALAAGLPVIATKCGGPEDFINQKNGILIEPNKLNDLMVALHKIYDEGYKYNRLDISNQAIKRFSGSVIAKELERLYIDILLERNTKNK